MQTSLAERRRVARHIRRGERRARTRSPKLTHLQRMIRELLLGELDAYIRAGRFPKNREFPWKMPVFVDGEGTRCAMAHLMEIGGAAEVVQRVSQQSNFAFLRELALMPEVAQWLEAAGITVDEAALIQPQYCQQAYSDCVCDVSWSQPFPQAVGVLEATVTATGSARVDVVYGDGLGYQAGDVVKVNQGTLGQTVLVSLTASEAKPDAGVDASAPSNYFNSLALDSTGRPTACGWNETVKKLPVSKQQAVDALRAKSCGASLGTVDAKWSEKPPCSSGCNTSGEPASASVAILLAVVGAVVAMRRARGQ